MVGAEMPRKKLSSRIRKSTTTSEIEYSSSSHSREPYCSCSSHSLLSPHSRPLQPLLATVLTYRHNLGTTHKHKVHTTKPPTNITLK